MDQITIDDFQDKVLLLPEHQNVHSISNFLLNVVSIMGIENPSYIEVHNNNTLFTKLEMGLGYAITGSEVIKMNKNLCGIELNPSFDVWNIIVVKKSNRTGKAIIDYIRLLNA